jgi:hypothetical protein
LSSAENRRNIRLKFRSAVAGLGISLFAALHVFLLAMSEELQRAPIPRERWAEEVGLLAGLAFLFLATGGWATLGLTISLGTEPPASVRWGLLSPIFLAAPAAWMAQPIQSFSLLEAARAGEIAFVFAMSLFGFAGLSALLAPPPRRRGEKNPII